MLIKDSSIYSKLAENKGEKNDCCVRAFTVATNKPYDEIHSLHAKHGRKFRKGTYMITTHKVLGELGFEEVKIEKKMTVGQFVSLYPKGTYYCHKAGHAFAIVDGVVHDWASTTSQRTQIKFVAKPIGQEMKKEIKIDGTIRNYRGFDLVKVRGMFYTHDLFDGKALHLKDAKQLIDMIYRRMILNGGSISKNIPALMKELNEQPV